MLSRRSKHLHCRCLHWQLEMDSLQHLTSLGYRPYSGMQACLRQHRHCRRMQQSTPPQQQLRPHSRVRCRSHLSAAPPTALPRGAVLLPVLQQQPPMPLAWRPLRSFQQQLLVSVRLHPAQELQRWQQLTRLARRTQRGSAACWTRSVVSVTTAQVHTNVWNLCCIVLE